MIANRLVLNWLGLFALTVMWGSAFALTRAAVEVLEPSSVVLGRLLIGAVVLLAWWVMVGGRWPRGVRLWLFLLAIAIVGNVVPFNLIAWGQQTVDSGIAGVLMAIMPLFTLVLAHFLVPGERLTARRLFGFIVGLGGVVILMGPDIEPAGASGANVFWAGSAILGGAFCYAVSAILSRLRPSSEVVSSAMVTTLIGAAAMSVGLGIDAPTALLADASTVALAAIALLGVFSTAVAAVVYFQLIERSGPSFVSQLNYLIPLWAVLLGALVFGERLSSSDYLAIVVILTGVLITQPNPTTGRSAACRPRSSATDTEATEQASRSGA
jgi:drug/metabolite transporter (DMT)-like permease